MKTIHKFPLIFTDIQTVEMPRNSKIIHINYQEDTICIWAMVTPEEKLDIRTFIIAGTGHKVDDICCAHRATLQKKGFVWHIFEKIL